MDELVRVFLQPLHPKSILSVGRREWPALCNYVVSDGTSDSPHYQHETPERALKKSTRVDLAVVHHIDQLPKELLFPLLGILKNLRSDQVWLVVGKGASHTPQELIAHGFRKDPMPDKCPFLSYSYNLETYNHQRDWNNARFWANPENWHRRF